MSNEDTYWNTPRAYYLSAFFLFLVVICDLFVLILLPDFWNSLDPSFSFIPYVTFFAGAVFGALMIYLGWSLEKKKTRKDGI